MNFRTSKHVKKLAKRSDVALKSVHTEVLGLSPSDDESMKVEVSKKVKSNFIKLAKVPCCQFYCRRSLEQTITFCDSEVNC